MKTPYSELQNKICTIAKEKRACASEYKRALSAKDEVELLQVISDNLGWCVENEAVSHEYFSLFDPKIYLESGIANVGKDNTGYRNTGYSNTGDRNTGNWNTGDSNTGYSNTGDSNTGDRNTGNWNTGDRNTGNWNTGDSNTGYSNTGDSNTGNRNTGDRNTGNWNTGDRNTGNWNTGNWNTGDSNTGYRNTGNWNTGDRNTGYSNTGDRNTGAFCSVDAPFPMFNKPSDWTEQDFLNSKAHSLLCEVDTKLWVPEHAMTEEEKANHKGWKTCEGFYRDIPFKQAFTDRWNNWSAKNREAFTSLPNFDAAVFESITGVKI